jgi:hypothetical protein
VAGVVHEMDGGEREEAAPLLVEDAGLPQGWQPARRQDLEGGSSHRLLQ